MKSKKKILKLMVKNDTNVPLRDWDYVWATEEEVSEYMKKGYMFLKKEKGFENEN